MLTPKGGGGVREWLGTTKGESGKARGNDVPVQARAQVGDLTNFVSLPLMALLAACAGESTSPDVDPGTAAGDPVALQVFPRSVTIETSQRVQFRGQSETMTGDSSRPPWCGPPAEAASARRLLLRLRTGMYKIFARGRGWKHTDTALVHVVPPQPKVARIVVAPLHHR